MKFEITEEQALELESTMAVHHAANTTLQTALNHHSEIMMKNQAKSEEIWSEIIDDHELDMKNLDWAFTRINGTPYVISESRQGETDGKD